MKQQTQAVGQQGQARSSIRERELAERTIEVAAGAGAVRVRLNGHGHLRGLDISPEAFADRDPELLADLILGAVAEANRRADALAAADLPDAPGAL